jgi:PAS domain S-box-containing protein
MLITSILFLKKTSTPLLHNTATYLCDFQSNMFEYASDSCTIHTNFAVKGEEDMDAQTKQLQDLSLYKTLLSEVLKRSSSAILLLNSQAEIIFCTPAITSLTGYNCEELIGKSAFEYLHPADIPAARLQHDYLLKEKENASAFVIRIRNKYGQMIWIEMVAKNWLHAGEINGVFVLLKSDSDGGVEELKLVKAVAAAKEGEREFLATELHDNINQVITATKLIVDSALLRIEREDLLKLASENLQLAIEEIRKLTYSMVSYDLQEFGLSFALQAFMKTVSCATGALFHTSLQEDAVNKLSKDQQLHVYRILQESITNIIRHSGATITEIALSRKEDQIQLTITDNGKGFSLNRLKPGLGLSSITNRVKILEGHFHVHSEPSKGTSIEINFPI